MRGARRKGSCVESGICEFKISRLVRAVLGDHKVQRVSKWVSCQSRTKVEVNGSEKGEAETIKLWSNPGCTSE